MPHNHIYSRHRCITDNIEDKTFEIWDSISIIIILMQCIAITIYAFKTFTSPLSLMHSDDELSSFVWNISFWTKAWKNSFFYYSLLMSVKIIIITIIIKKLICKAVSVYRMILYCWHYKIFSGNKKIFQLVWMSSYKKWKLWNIWTIF